METNWTIETQDGATIYGVKNSASVEPSEGAVFIVHGLSGCMHEYAFKRAADYFQEKYDVYRFNLYDWHDGARTLIDCTIKTHADDLNAVLNAFSLSYKKNFLVGHSYGGPSVMMANPSGVTAVSLWDPTFDLTRIKKDFKRDIIEDDQVYVVSGGVHFLIGKDMYEEAGKLDEIECIKLSKSFSAPVQVINAAEGLYVHDKISYNSFGHKNNCREVISGSEHCFVEGDSCDCLLDKTLEWFSQF